MTWGGRATMVPRLLRALFDPAKRRAAERSLADAFEHQDSVLQATPYAVPFLLAIVATSDRATRAAAWRLCKLVFAAAHFAATYQDVDASRLSLTRPLGLWPKFVSEYQDEILWEDDDGDLWPTWQVLTLEAFRRDRPLLEKLAGERLAGAKSLLAQLDAGPS